jgi:hypothetical protein
MTSFRLFAVTWTVALALAAHQQAWAQVPDPSIRLVVGAGRPLRVALDRRIIVKRTGQAVTATLVEPVFAYDRIVVPAGTKVAGHIGSLTPVPGRARAAAMLSGDFTPLHDVRLQFDTLILSDGRTVPIQTSVTAGTENVRLQVAGPSKANGAAARAREELARRGKQAASTIRAPGKAERLKNMLIRALPYHPEFLPRGTVYSATLLSPLDFGAVTPVERAPPGTAPAPESVLNARLVTPLDSATTVAGTRIDAVLTQPVFAADRRLILPEGARLTGEVTLTRRARRFHRNGQLRFLFETVQASDRAPEKLLASLYSVESGQDRLAVDEEGGTSVTGAKTRFVAPALGALALAGTMHGRLDYDTDGAGPETQYGGAGSSTVGGFLGAGLIGVGLSQLSRPITVAIGVAGLARSTYAAVFGKGREISFPADTSIQVQLAPGPSPRKP